MEAAAIEDLIYNAVKDGRSVAETSVHRRRRPYEGNALRRGRSRRSNPACSACPGFCRTCFALRASSEPAAKEAIALFVYRIVRELGSLSPPWAAWTGRVLEPAVWVIPTDEERLIARQTARDSALSDNPAGSHFLAR
jgi:hypothetical protein